MDLLQALQDYGTVGAALLAALGLGSLGAALISSRASKRDVAMRRRVETAKVFMAVSARAHGTREDGSQVGAGERAAALFLLADLAVRDKELRWAGAAQLSVEHSQTHVWLRRAEERLEHDTEMMEAEMARYDGDPDDLLHLTDEANYLHERARTVAYAAHLARGHLYQPRRWRYLWLWLKSAGRDRRLRAPSMMDSVRHL